MLALGLRSMPSDELQKNSRNARALEASRNEGFGVEGLGFFGLRV